MTDSGHLHPALPDSPDRRRWLGATLACGLACALAPGRLFGAETTASRASTLRMADFRAMAWRDVANGQALIEPPFYSPVLADPTLVMPAQSPDQRWHLFAHSALGILHYSADEPTRWHAHGLVVWHGMRAFVLCHDDAYWLYYEAYAPFALARTALPETLRTQWRSWLCRRRSVNLTDWGPAEIVLTPSRPWHGNQLGQATGNPCVVRLSDTPGPAQWGLYYSGGLVFIPDCGFTEPYAIGRATAPSPAGPWQAEPEPLISPAPTDAALNLSAGSLKVLRVADGFVGFQNAIAWVDDAAGGHSTSVIYLLWSGDGRTWQRHATPVLAPGAPHWRRSHIYACDVRCDERNGDWWLFYNARDDWPMSRGKEAIGALRAT